MMKEGRVVPDQAADKAWPCSDVAPIGLEIKWLAFDHSKPLSLTRRGMFDCRIGASTNIVKSASLDIRSNVGASLDVKGVAEAIESTPMAVANFRNFRAAKPAEEHNIFGLLTIITLIYSISGSENLFQAILLN
ncbi:hypothetical protein AB9E28_02320 [Rhizobium leguminosarum]|uniref:hypothetical protein n=1 Tax=Rhizobium leguminosarum TaxID=384 RepID=UPI003F95D204